MLVFTSWTLIKILCVSSDSIIQTCRAITVKNYMYIPKFVYFFIALMVYLVLVIWGFHLK